MSLNSLYDLFVDELKDVYSAEKQLVEALPKMSKAASNSELAQTFQYHHETTKSHLETIRGILDELEENPGNKVCVGMEGLIKEGQSIIEMDGSAAAKDAALILAAQKAEHYEIASYGALRRYAELLNYGSYVGALEAILDDEGETNEKLTALAKGSSFEEGLNEEAQT